MAVCLLFIGLIGLIVLIYRFYNPRESIVLGALLFSLLILSVTELLSLLKQLNYSGILSTWFLIDILIGYCLYRNSSVKVLLSLFEHYKQWLKKLSVREKFIAAFSLVLLFGAFIQGIIYPTNNWDSMSYHMPRIIHWIQNESLDHYRTIIYPQINSPPFAEMVILHVNLLMGNDYLSNFVQLFYLTVGLVTISLIAKEMNQDRFAQLIAVFIVLTLPESILLSTSTHNELVLIFFMLVSIYFFIKTWREPRVIYFLILGSSIGLAVATKSTGYIYIAPFFVVWLGAMIYSIILKKLRLNGKHYLYLGACFVLINVGQYSRNYRLTSNVFGIDDTIKRYYVNESHSLKSLVSNMSRNLSNQFGLPKIAPIVEGLTIKLHNWMKINPNDPKITSHTYAIDPLATHENNGANTYHMLLILISLPWFFMSFTKERRLLIFYWLSTIGSFILFCFYLKWQPWIKLHAPFFFFYSIPLSIFLLSNIKNKITKNLVMLGFAIIAISTMLFNWSRPYVTVPPYTAEVKVNDNRYKKYFSRFMRFHDDFKRVNEQIQNLELKNIGLDLGPYDIEYPLFKDAYWKEKRPIHINAHRLCQEIPVEPEIDCIVSSKFSEEITHNNKVYRNTSGSKDKYLYLFLEE